MDLPSFAELAPQIVIALVVIGAVAWFRKQDMDVVKSLREEQVHTRKLLTPPQQHQSAEDTGRFTSPFVRMEESLKEIKVSVKEVQSEQQHNSQRLAVLEANIKWLREHPSIRRRFTPSDRPSTKDKK